MQGTGVSHIPLAVVPVIFLEELLLRGWLMEQLRRVSPSFIWLTPLFSVLLLWSYAGYFWYEGFTSMAVFCGGYALATTWLRQVTGSVWPGIAARLIGVLTIVGLGL